MYDVDYIFDRHSVSHILVPGSFFLKVLNLILFCCLYVLLICP